MKYKIVIVNYDEDNVYPMVKIITSENKYEMITWTMDKTITDQFENKHGWFALNLYGIHIFETDDLETFDLMEAQREKDKQEVNFVYDTRPIERKAEIRRIAEQVFVHPACESVNSAVGIARAFYDNFDAEFEKLEGEK